MRTATNDPSVTIDTTAYQVCGVEASFRQFASILACRFCLVVVCDHCMNRLSWMSAYQMILEMGHAFADDLIRGAYAVSQNRTGDQILRVDLETFLGTHSVCN